MFHASQILGCRNEQTAASWLEEKQAGVRFTCATGPESDLVGGNRYCPLHPIVSQKKLQFTLPWRSRAGASQRVPPPQCRNGLLKRGPMADERQAMVTKVGLISLGGVILLAFIKMIFHLVGWVAAAMSPGMLCSSSRSWLMPWSTCC